jgi:hypothetical protein
MDGTLLGYGFFGAVQAVNFLCRPLSATVGRKPIVEARMV